jgi:hypothetical protein
MIVSMKILGQACDQSLDLLFHLLKVLQLERKPYHLIVHAAHSQAVVHIVHSYRKILASIFSFHYGLDDSPLVALSTELVLVPPVGGT